MDVSDLRIFEAVARLGGMTPAAAELNTVQSNVTTRVRMLEDELGTPLFERHSRGVRTTPAGDRLLPYAQRLGALVEEARRVARDEGEPTGKLTIGSLETTAAARLSPMLAEYAGRYPAIDLVLRTGTSEELIAQVLDQETEGALVAGPVDHPELDWLPVFREELMLATSPRIRGLDELGKAGEMKIAVLRAGCSYRQRLEDVLARRGIVNLRKLELGTIDAILGCVAAGLGVTLLPRVVVEGAARNGAIRAHKLPAKDARVDTGFVRRRDAFESSGLRALVSMLQDPAPALAAE